MYAHLQKVTYTESDEIFLNPERGWYTFTPFTFRDGNIPEPLNKAIVQQKRGQGFALLHTIYHMHDFRDKPLSDTFLDVVGKNMQALRDGGSKCTLRFAYTNSMNEKAQPWDAPVELVHHHIEQLKPVLQEYGDVIFIMESGFVGAWGEWYYTTNFGFRPQTPEDYEPRRKLLEAQLDALPSDRMICIRYPRAKMTMFGLELKDTLTVKEAYNGTPLARIAGHNDCFVSSPDDVGTYHAPEEREFWKAETKYLVMGGETCRVSPYGECRNTIEQMENYHWTYLNQDYNKSILQGWKDNDCYAEVERRLGYRLVLSEAYFSPRAAKKKSYEVVMKIRNAGFAAPVNPRNVELVFADKADSSKRFKVKLREDPRYWFAGGEYTVHAVFQLPEELKRGSSYDIFLNLPDPKPMLADRPEYSIRLANTGVWESATGFNRIHSVTIE